MKTGRIMKGIGGFYYVDTDDGIYECKAKGIFRNQKIKPLVGDMAGIEIIDEAHMTGTITELFPRKSTMIRPALANVEQVILVFAADAPAPNRNLIDRFLVMMSAQNMKVILCVNKCDLAEDEFLRELRHDYCELAGYEMCLISAVEGYGLDELLNKLHGHVSALAGPSGVGKSTLMNRLVDDANMETGEISKKIQRGRHTTRHSECFQIDGDSVLIDTPGFASVYVDMVEAEAMEMHFHEFLPYIDNCRYMGCAHIKEKDCGVKDAWKAGKIADSRYENYCLLYEERKNARRY